MSARQSAARKTKRVLVADVPDGIRSLEIILGEHAEILEASSLDQALRLLETGVDLVVCGVHFHESRMYDFLRMTKANPETRSIPFVCYRDIDSALSQPLLDGLVIACAALGAARFLDLFELKARFGVDRADAEFRQILVGLLESAEREP